MTRTAAIEALWRAGKRADAIEAAKKVAEDDTAKSVESIDMADMMERLAQEYGVGRDADEAMCVSALLRSRAWPQDDPQCAHANQGLIAWYARTGRYQEAEKELERSREVAKRFVGQSIAPLRSLLRLSAEVADQSGRLLDAIAFLQRAIEVEETHGNANADELGPLYRALAQSFLRVDKMDEAAAALESSLQVPHRRLSGPEEAEVLSQLASLRERQGRVQAAVRLTERAVEKCEAEFGLDDAHTLRHRRNLARLRALDARPE